MRSPRKRRPSQPPPQGAALLDALPRIIACLRALDVPEQEIGDLTNNVVVTAYTARERYDPEAGSEAAWLLGIARLTVKGARRKAVRRGTEPVDAEALAGTAQMDPHEALRAREARELLERMLARLSPERRAVIEAKHLAGRSFHEIAEDMGLPFETVRKMERLGWQELEREARRIRAKARHRKQDGLPMLLPFLPRRSVVPMLVGALGGALVTAILLLGQVTPTTAGALSHLSAPAVARATPPEDAGAEAVAAAEAAPRPVATASATATAAKAGPAPGGRPPMMNEEIALLQRALRAANAGRGTEASALLAQHMARYPRSEYAPDRTRILRLIEGKPRAR